MTIENLNEAVLIPYSNTHTKKVCEWFRRESIVKWLDMGLGKQNLTDLELHILFCNPNNKVFLYGPEKSRLVGLMSLNGYTHEMGLGEVWGLRGEKGGGRNLTVSAFLRTIATGFLDFDREVISTWVAEPNILSHRVHDKCGFRSTGRLRSAHVLENKRCDRILYDVTKQEFAAIYPNIQSLNGKTFAKKK